jgi:23S rRNA pseudouridine2604 synthase
MTFRHRLQYFLVKNLQISNKQALTLIQAGQVSINNQPIYQNIVLSETDSISYQNQILQKGKQYLYYIFNKPAGIECTQNPAIPHNLLPYLPQPNLFIIGRLDKASTGLVLFTNNGKIHDSTLRPEQQVEKEYLVTLNKPISTEFLALMASGVKILGQYTLPCQIWQKTECQFQIILTQGRNRQIRRMCHKLGYQVLALHRLRIGNIHLEQLPVGTVQQIHEPNI